MQKVLEMELLKFGSILVCVLIKVREGQSIFEISPNPLAYVLEGTSLDLICDVEYNVRILRLTRQPSNDSLIVYNIQELDNRCLVQPSLDPAEYQYSCSSESFSWTIYNVTIERHAEIWTCSDGFFPEKSLGTTIWVKVPVKYIKLSRPVANPIYVIENFTTELECSTSRERPRSTIKWWFRNSNYSLGTGLTVPDDDEELTRTYSTLKFTFSRSQNGSSIYCSAVNDKSERPVRSNSTQIIVLFPPVKPTLKVGTKTISGNLTVIQSENVTILCESVSEPSPPTYNWTDQDAGQSILTIENIQFPVTKRCTATNTMEPTIGAPVNGLASVWLYIDVLFSPSKPVLKMGTRVIPSFLAVIRGDNATVACESTSKPKPEIHWTGQAASASSTIKINNIQSKITSQCTATNTMHPTFGSPVQGISNASLYIYVMSGPTVPRFTYVSNSNLTLSVAKLVVLKGTEFLIKCFGSTSFPGPPQYSWSGPVTSNTDTISFTGIDVQQEGNYTCHVVNNMTRTVGAGEIGRNMNSLSIAVQYPPIVQVSSDNLRIVENEQVDIACSATSKPSPTSFIWTGSKSSFSLSSSNLAILHTRREDTGVYVCTVHNQMQSTVEGNIVGEGSANVTLTVLYHPDVTLSQFDGTVITEGDPSIILCSARGEPNNYIFSKWTHFAMDGSTKIREITSSRTSNDKAYLEFQKTNYMDSGVYKCGVSNGINDYKTGDSVATKTVKQVVKGRPVIIQENTTVSARTHANISISATYYPNDGSIPTVKWYRKKGVSRYEISNGADKFIENSAIEVPVPYYSVIIQQPGYMTKLVIKEASENDFTDYEIEIANSINKVVFTVKLLPQGPPSPPSMFSVVLDSTTSSSVTLSWKPGFHGGFSQTFYIQYNTSATPMKSIVSIFGGIALSSTTFNVTVFNLTSQTQYFFRIYAENKYGRSDFTSNQLAVTTKPIALDEQEQTSNTGATVGGAIAGIVVAVVVILVVLFFLRRYKRLPFDVTSLRRAFKWNTHREEPQEPPQGQLHDHVYYNQTKITGKLSGDKETNLEIRSVTNENANPNLFRLSSPYEKLDTENQRSGENAYEDLEVNKSAEHSYANILDTKCKQKPEIPQKPRMTKKLYANTKWMQQSDASTKPAKKDAKRKQKPEVPKKPWMTKKLYANTSGRQQSDASAKPSMKGDQKAKTTESPYMNLKLSSAQQL